MLTAKDIDDIVEGLEPSPLPCGAVLGEDGEVVHWLSQEELRQIKDGGSISLPNGLVVTGAKK